MDGGSNYQIKTIVLQYLKQKKKSKLNKALLESCRPTDRDSTTNPA